MTQRAILPGSTRTMLSGARVVGPVPENDRIEVTLVLSPQRDLGAQGSAGQTARKEVVDRLAASADAVSAVRDFASQYGLDVVEADPQRRIIKLAGTVAQMRQAFGVALEMHESPTGVRFRGRTGAISLPATLVPYVRGVLGLDNRPQASPHLRKLQPRRTAAVSYRPQDVAQLYGFPSGTGQGQTIALIELGGAVGTNDLQQYFNAMGVANPPTVQAVNVTTQPAKYGEDPGSDGEVMLDVEVVGAIAPGAKINVYFGDNTDQGFYDVLSRAIYDPGTSIVSISWGGPEDSWTDQSRSLFDELGQAAAALGISVFCAAGDDGASDQRGAATDKQQHVDFPASSPHFIACGGTRLESQNGGITAETVWNQSAIAEGSTGGGISKFFPVPPFQAASQAISGEQLVHRGVPDVAGNADPETGYRTRSDGVDSVSGGTSAVAPLWAAFTALLNERLGKTIGFFPPVAYSSPTMSSLFNDITQGDNSYNGVSGYSAHPGWDACTGLGSPIGSAWEAALRRGTQTTVQAGT
jgi:kumamolisin